MDLTVREMRLEEVGVIVDYFHQATPEHLAMLGVDPARLPSRAKWVQHYAHQYSLPLEQRETFLVIWKLGDAPLGFCTTDKMVLGEQVYMHLHLVEPKLRRSGYGTACVRETVGIYFEALRVRRVFCEPNAFNTGPNRTLQKVGFKYLQTYMTVPGAINYHQAVTCWVLEKS